MFFINLEISVSTELFLTVINYTSLISVAEQGWRFQRAFKKIIILKTISKPY